ncbi:DNA mismatch repair protein MutT [Sporosarcina luteola]|uniref:DNA mismatch repair protein MutT n=1 Tax=Sporosarcina luteola TaxID=582850 RepID=A0A511ZCK0_9BACL|nr:NUDIX hydrolase [Sporosarcina luteola]GEN85174.1 DNA mismatch repair protein MutT [Sporosarcina luteola]
MGYIEDLRKVVGHRPLIFVGSVIVVVDEQGRLLLQQRKFPEGAWGIPGGLMELGESTEEVARRELFEETRLRVDELTLINVYSGHEHFIRAANGDEFYVVTTAYYAEGAIGELVVDQAESITFTYFHPDELPENIVKSHKEILDEFLLKHYSFLSAVN